MLPAGDVVAHRSTGGLLHGDALELGPLPQRCLLGFGQPQRHGHASMVSKRYQWCCSTSVGFPGSTGNRLLLADV
ncbi:MAG: hypothetical protein AVDCRST_MAG76-1529 [uncultured Acidimicrobiales bacterium]|uniref:Uncharacterized protein n=1 Tax=uncultured Acidimicrobiales bacterium TaxID=310071 RepID=A0A6J4HWZ8_9ACTN|nr:MAG: hypothetical protein AVDCRST_MAG76-1529 [uncultured Acidimicrobiales bacterium]